MFFPADFVNECTGLKQFWPRWHNHTNSPYTILHRRDLWQYQVRQQGPGVFGPLNIGPNMGPISHRNLAGQLGKWWLIEHYFRMNTVNDIGGDTSQADGILRVWVTIDDVTHQTFNYTNMKWLRREPDGTYRNGNGQASNGTFDVVQFNPTYGGSTCPSPETQFYFVDNVYSSGS